jgi:hypothetical protein
MDAAATRYLRVSGTLLPDNRLYLRPSYLTESAVGAIDDRSSGVTIECLSDEKLLLRWGATLRPVRSARGAGAKEMEAEPLLLKAKVPYPQDTRRIVFRKGESLLAEIAVPTRGPQFTQAPTVTRARRGLEVDWRAEHPDGLPLYFHVRASADGGKTWVRLGSRLAKPVLAVPDGALVGGKKCVVEVVAYDGVNTVSRRIRYPRAPSDRLEVLIFSPLARTLKAGERVPLWAHARMLGRAQRIDPIARFEWSVGGKRVASGSSATWVATVGALEIAVDCRFSRFRAHAARRITVEPAAAEL